MPPEIDISCAGKQTDNVYDMRDAERYNLARKVRLKDKLTGTCGRNAAPVASERKMAVDIFEFSQKCP